MKGRYSLLCDAANKTEDGKVNILGEFNLIHAESFPAAHPSACYVAALEVGQSDAAVHEIELRYVDDDGGLIAPPIALKLDLSNLITIAGETTSIPIILPIHGLHVAAPGRYCLDLWRGAELLSSCFFNGTLRGPAQPS